MPRAAEFDLGLAVFLIAETQVTVSGKLVDVKTGAVLWEGRAMANEASNHNNNGGLLGAVISAAVMQAVSSATDYARDISRQANAMLIFTEGTGLLFEPHSAKHAH